MRTLLGLSPWVVAAAGRVLVVALSVTSLGPLLHGAHDSGCDTPLLLHDPSQHRVSASTPADATPAAEGDHCVACHWVRTSRGPVSWEFTGLQALAAGSVLPPAEGHLLPAPAAVPLPARAPPAQG